MRFVWLTAVLAGLLLAPAARADGPAAPTVAEPADPTPASGSPAPAPDAPPPAKPARPKRHEIMPRQQPSSGVELMGEILGNILLAPLEESTETPPPALLPVPANDLAPDPAAGTAEPPQETTPAPAQSFYDLHSALTLDIGYSFGGENLVQPKFLGRYADTTTTLHAGEGLALGLSWVQLFRDSGYGIKAGIDYTYNTSCSLGYGSDNASGGSSCRYEFWHGGSNVMALFPLGGSYAPWRTVLGTGLTLQYSPVLEASGKTGRKLRETDFDAALGVVLQLQWKSYSLRYTRITYHTSTGARVDGSGIGLFFTYQFW